MVRQRLSLRAQAVAWLAQREHSELELRRKLQRRLKDEACRADGQAGSSDTGVGPADGLPERQAAPLSPEEMLGQIDAVIAWLVERGYLDTQRFVASRVHVRSGRYGLGRIQQELAQHGLALSPEVTADLRSSEFERALALWQRRFGAPATDQREAARQSRFLAGRGFSGEVVRRVLRSAKEAAVDGDQAQGRSADLRDQDPVA